MIEALVALFVVSIGLLGLAMLQIEGMKFGTDSYLRTQATLMGTDLMDRIIANKVAADAGAYCLDVTAPSDPCGTNAAPSGANASSCGDLSAGCATPEELAKYDLTTWYDALAASLPESDTSRIERTSVATSGGVSVFRYQITINWKERDQDMTQIWVADL